MESYLKEILSDTKPPAGKKLVHLFVGSARQSVPQDQLAKAKRIMLTDFLLNKNFGAEAEAKRGNYELTEREGLCFKEFEDLC